MRISDWSSDVCSSDLAQQVRKPEHREALRLGVAVHGIGLNVGPVGQQPVEDVDSLVDAARDEVAEQRDVLVGHVVITDAAIAAVADEVSSEEHTSEPPSLMSYSYAAF